MYTLGISNFPIPGESGFPLNAMYTKPANRNDEGKANIFSDFKVSKAQNSKRLKSGEESSLFLWLHTEYSCSWKHVTPTCTILKKCNQNLFV